MAAKKKATQRRAPTPALIIKVTGPGIRPGRVPIPELLLLCQHAQAAVSRQAEALEGRQTMHRGPKIGRVQGECTLELVSLGRGSAILGFEQAKSQPSLVPFSDLGKDAIASVAIALRSIADGSAEDVAIDPGVLQSLGDLAAVVRNGVRRIELRVPGGHNQRAIRATIDRKVQARIARRLQPPTTKTVEIDGVIEMVDFKIGDYRCRIHQPVGAAVPCTFTADVEDQVFANVRRPVHVVGTGTVNPHSGRLESVEIRTVTPVDPLRLNAESFFKGLTFDQLADEQAIDPIRDPRQLAGVWREDDDVDAFVAETYRSRH